MSAIKLIISDFDGTLVDTFEANFLAYEAAFKSLGLKLTCDTYRRCFGMRFDRFMDSLGIESPSLRRDIRDRKTSFYPQFFDRLKVNHTLLDFIKTFRDSGNMTAIASTARVENLMNALNHINAVDCFDLILAGEQVTKGKPDPEIYLTVLNRMNVMPGEALIFEDSPVGIKAAEAAGVRYITVNQSYFK